MWLTLTVIVAFCLYLSCLYKISRYFYLHSLFLLPLYPAIFFIDHNGHYLVPGAELDSVHYAVKLLPLYLNIVYLVLRFKPRVVRRLTFTTVIANLFLLYNVGLAVIYSVYHASMLPIFYMSYSVPLYALFFNSRNFVLEVARLRRSRTAGKRLLEVYFMAFLFIYAASIYYSIYSNITSTLLDSRGVGSIFASTSALIYCFMFAPLLASLTGKRWPLVAIVVIGMTSLSKTALLMLPAFTILLYRKFRNNIAKYSIYYSAAAVLLVSLAPALIPSELVEEWEYKFSLGSHETFLEKAYMNRIDLYEDALKVIRDFPYGIGVGNFERYSHNSYRDPHNFALTTICESGALIGGLFLLAMIGGAMRTVAQVGRGAFDFNHFSFISLFLAYFFAGGVLQTTGTSEVSTIYYTPFYGAMIFQLLALSDRGVSRAAAGRMAPLAPRRLGAVVE